MNNNDIIAINNLSLGKSDFIEFEKAIRKRSAKVAFVIVVICVAVIYVAAIASALLKTHIVSGALLILIAFCLIISILMYVVFPHWLGGIRYKQYCMTHNSTGRMIFYLDRLGTMVGEEAVQTLFYTDIKRIVQTDNLFIMEFSNKVYSIVRKDGFSEGCLEAVQNRLLEK
nr:YcxB family protein [uncultured Caproiciproducens sp.]